MSTAEKKKLIAVLTYLFFAIVLIFSVWVAFHLLTYFYHEIPYALDNYFGGSR
ncbi:hypothetical protein IV38_GL001757 [Lactobacillus selangorensis]|uniref:Uncharacterized protein n=1 Tax=Lactobacillus selangorensis TaxID=81857 RepID=A0A0R2FI38_9LACO|nr:hypothetical protein [Lactobacillus selangorensis]KRN27918.1 hypothetical protein IV38_GL001757 [Lactobacillus selangorensis]KRN30611.1 hypothetical protein IV40_GL001798 [Lactobacillus selangorensis]